MKLLWSKHREPDGHKDAELARGEQRLEDLRQRVQRIRDTTKVVTIRAQYGKLRPER